MKRFKIYGISALVVLFVIVVFQNTATTELKFLAWEISMSRVLLFPLILAVGFFLGFLCSKWPKKNG